MNHERYESEVNKVTNAYLVAGVSKQAEYGEMLRMIRTPGAASLDGGEGVEERGGRKGRQRPPQQNSQVKENR